MSTNKLLKRVMQNTTRYKRRDLASTLSVNIETCEPILNSKMTKDSKDNLFVYVDKHYKILGFTKGYEIMKDYNDSFAIYTEYPKNRKNLLKNATFTLAFTPEMRTFNIKKYKMEETKTLKDRLNEYKAKKHRDITNEQMQDIIQSILSKLNDDIFTNKLPIKLKGQSGYSNITTTLISRFSILIQEFNWRVLDIERELKYYKDKENREVPVEYLYSYKFYIKVKNEILMWNKLLSK